MSWFPDIQIIVGKSCSAWGSYFLNFSDKSFEPIFNPLVQSIKKKSDEKNITMVIKTIAIIADDSFQV